jgi:hypothetical protein
MKQDPAALAFFGAALAVLAGLLLYVFFFKTPEPASEVRAFALVREWLREKTSPPRPAPPSQPPAQRAPGPPAGQTQGAPLQAGHLWRYTVTLDPPTWREAVLTYRTQRVGEELIVNTQFTHAAGKMEFRLGTFAAGHYSHANTRFPGFFLYPSYFLLPLQPGREMSWSWPWQGGKAGSMKRYVATFLRWEQLQVPAGTYRAAVIEVRLSYVDGGQATRAVVRETLWYAPDIAQLVKVVREGHSPDEVSTRIVAELAEYR